jgi:HEAT repeat protein
VPNATPTRHDGDMSTVRPLPVTGWTRAIGLRPGEGSTVALIALAFAALEAGRGFGEIGADTLVVSLLGPGALPYLFIGLGAVSLVAALAYGAALGRLPRVRLLAGVPFGAAAILVIERIAIATGHPAALGLAWLTVYAVGALGVTIAWTMAGSVFDSRQAKRLFPLCTAAAIAGSFVGTLSAGPVARAIGTESLIVLEAILLTVLGLTIIGLWRTTTVRAPAPRRDRSLVADLRVGFDEVVRTPLLRLVALAYVLLAILLFSVTYPFLLAASETFPNEADLATALGLLSAGVTAASFVLSVAVAGRVYTRIGIAGAALLLPLVYVAGFGLWIVAFSFATAALFRFSQQATQRGLSNAAWTAFYNTVPNERRAQVLAFNDGVPGQIGTMLSGVLLLASGSLLARDQVFWLGLLTAIACTVVVALIRRGYAASVIRTLRSGLGEQVLEGGPGLAALTRDPAVAASLVEALRSPEVTIRCMAADLLGRSDVETAGVALVRVVDDDPDPEVRAAALEGLARLGGPPIAAAAAEACLADADPRVRIAAIHALGSVVPDRHMIDAIPQIDDLLADPVPGVRGAVAWLFGSIGEDANAEAIIAALLDGRSDDERVAGLEAMRHLGRPVPDGIARLLLTDHSPRVRTAALEAIAASGELERWDQEAISSLEDESVDVRRAAARGLASLEHTPSAVFEVLGTGSPQAQDAALRALDGHGPEVRDRLIEWTLARIDRASGLRRARLGCTVALGTLRTAMAATNGSAASAVSAMAATSDPAAPPGTPTAESPAGAEPPAEADPPAVDPDPALAPELVERPAATSSAFAYAGASALTGPTLAFLLSVLARRERRAEELSLRALTVLGAPEATGVIRRCLHSADPETRAQAIEALDSIGDRRLSGALVRLMELDIDRVPTGEAAVARLVDDDDPWVSRLARRVIEGGTELPETSRTLGDLETMLVLRRVPLFEGLDPEDLQRIAMHTVEHLYPAGEALVREGDIGDSIIVIVEGTVQVEKAEPDGSERLIRTYEQGDHIGELAVLREAPRAATVIAQDGGVRGLVIEGESLRAILRERPDAAMAMLATLAERISRQ